MADGKTFKTQVHISATYIGSFLAGYTEASADISFKKTNPFKVANQKHKKHTLKVCVGGRGGGGGMEIHQGQSFYASLTISTR